MLLFACTRVVQAFGSGLFLDVSEGSGFYFKRVGQPT